MGDLADPRPRSWRPGAIAEVRTAGVVAGGQWPCTRRASPVTVETVVAGGPRRGSAFRRRTFEVIISFAVSGRVVSA